MLEIMYYPLLALLGIALLSGAYGCQMVWHKVACLGDALAHGALLGLAAGILLNLPDTLSLFALSAVWAFFLWIMTRNKQTSADTVMAFLMQASMALAILFYALAGDPQAPLMHAFLGDVLLVRPKDIYFIFGLDFFLGIALWICWKKWVLIAISPDLAAAQKFNVSFYTFLFFLCIGFFVAQAMQYLGALLAPAFFVMPPLMARPLAKTPEKMAIIATLIALLSACAGVVLSFYADLPTGASIIGVDLILCLLLFFAFFIKKLLIKPMLCCQKNH